MFVFNLVARNGTLPDKGVDYHLETNLETYLETTTKVSIFSIDNMDVSIWSSLPRRVDLW